VLIYAEIGSGDLLNYAILLCFCGKPKNIKTGGRFAMEADRPARAIGCDYRVARRTPAGEQDRRPGRGQQPTRAGSGTATTEKPTRSDWPRICRKPPPANPPSEATSLAVRAEELAPKFWSQGLEVAGSSRPLPY